MARVVNPASGEPLGTAAEETARLLDSLNGWFGARTDAGANGHEPTDEPRAADGPPQAHSAACRACPLCRGLAYLQEFNPEVLTHLSDAAAHLVAAVRALTEPGREHAGAAEGAEDARARAQWPDTGDDGAHPSRAVRIDVQPDTGQDAAPDVQMDSEPREPDTAEDRASSAREQEQAP